MSFRTSEQLNRQKRLMARSAAVMFGAATIIDLVESAIPGGKTFSLAPGFGAFNYCAYGYPAHQGTRSSPFRAGCRAKEKRCLSTTLPTAASRGSTSQRVPWH